MDWFRIKHTLRMCFIPSPMKRAEYLKNHKVFFKVGKNCMVMFRKIPLYPKLISLGDNVWVASQVSFITHDVIHYMLNYREKKEDYYERMGCIDVKDNVFIGSNSTILYDVTIGPNTIVAAGSLVNRSLGEGVYAGVPARFVCSMEDYIEKRRDQQQIIPIYGKQGGLTEDTIEQFWDAFKNKEDA